ncbi:hypothetical protein GCK32_005964 [Trichostrongylus colubriformis]|uniref:Uncharacterized protein n=1 Tax=Trichostrongylus colubriformis TaxID=6319 RepID=A0AAN8EWR6_TRICO
MVRRYCCCVSQVNAFSNNHRSNGSLVWISMTRLLDIYVFGKENGSKCWSNNQAMDPIGFAWL